MQLNRFYYVDDINGDPTTSGIIDIAYNKLVCSCDKEQSVFLLNILNEKLKL